MKLRHPPHAHNHLKGKIAEAAALTAYILRGYLPARRPTRALAQTDLLLQRNQTLVLVEVKYRPSESAAHLALSPGQHQRLTREANALQKLYPRHHIRFDLCTVFPQWPFVRIVANIT
ncbi:MAG TPA: YraN family protein [Alphaproteobacteria bacterium]|nr:YraN family protein [Alphaproteobacteria bacterium]